jgi:hypothetical protein
MKEMLNPTSAIMGAGLGKDVAMCVDDDSRDPLPLLPFSPPDTLRWWRVLVSAAPWSDDDD